MCFKTRQAYKFIFNQPSKSSFVYFSQIYDDRLCIRRLPEQTFSAQDAIGQVFYLSILKLMYPVPATLTRLQPHLFFVFFLQQLIFKTTPAFQIKTLKQSICCLYKYIPHCSIENNHHESLIFKGFPLSCTPAGFLFSSQKRKKKLRGWINVKKNFSK